MTTLLIPAILAGLLVYVAIAVYIAGVVDRRLPDAEVLPMLLTVFWPASPVILVVARIIPLFERLYLYSKRDPAERRAARLEARQAQANRDDFRARVIRRQS